MKFSINLNDEQSQHFAQLIRGEEPQEPVTQTEMTQFFATCVRSALSLDPDYLRQCSAQEAGDFLASLSLDTIIE